MFNRKDETPDDLDTLIRGTLADMVDNATAGDDEESFERLLKNLERLERIKRERTENVIKREKAIDPNKVMAVGANIIGILAVLNYEQLHVIGSKAFGLVMKIR